MPKELDSLSAEEQQQVVDAISYITLLIAGSDGEIDLNEVRWGEKITRIRAFSYDEELRPFYKRVGANFTERLAQLQDELPDDPKERQAQILEELSKLNDILPKLDHFYARLYYHSLRTFAEHVAHASGGVLGWLSVGFEEYKIIDLPTINPIE